MNIGRKCLVCRSIMIVLLCLLSGVPQPAFARDAGAAPERTDDLTRSQKALLLNAGAALAIVGWGVLNWDYFSQEPRTHNEGWFGRATESGGADKLGHAYSAYLFSHGFSALYRSWGYPDDQAVRYGSYSAIGITGVMELGDAFSKDYGFSYEDMLMNLAGAGFGYLTERHPALARKVDLRWEYRPSLSKLEGDFVTDYEHSKYLLAVKAAGFDRTPRWLKPFEVQLGYYANSDDLPDGRERHVRTLYTAIGINLTRLLQPYYETRFFDYFQLPYIYLALEEELD